jgi:hypothetical protein
VLDIPLVQGSDPVWFGKNGVWGVGFRGVQANSLFPAISGQGMCCHICMGDECRWPPPDETFSPCPSVPLETLRGGVGTLLNASELPSSVLRRGVDVWLLAKGSGSTACAQLIAEQAALSLEEHGGYSSQDEVLHAAYSIVSVAVVHGG